MDGSLQPEKKGVRQSCGLPPFSVKESFCLEQGHGYIHAGGDDSHHAHELDQDVQGRAGRILEGVAHRIADNGCLMAFRAFAAHMALLNIFFGIVPRSAGISHEYGQHKAGSQAAGQQAEHAGNAENDTHADGGDDRQYGAWA